MPEAGLPTVPKARCAPSTASDPGSLPARVATALAAAAPDLSADARLGVAVSGGGDSLALLHLLNFLRPDRIMAVTVDHQLRRESRREADHVARTCTALGVPHRILTWEGWSGRGNLQDAARVARQRLIGAWAGQEGLAAVALGHTLDDQAETVLLRLARGSGVDGLSAMTTATRIGGTLWLRPMLDVRRADLRLYLSAAGLDWLDDPSNENEDFDRVKARVALEELSRIGLTRDGLSRTAAHQARARAALEWMTDRAAEQTVTAEAAGYARIDATAFATFPEEIRLRLLTRTLGWISGETYAPRFAALKALHDDMLAGGPPRSLQGSLASRKGDDILIVREPVRVGPAVRAGAIWDRRWNTTAEDPALWVAALGEAGLDHCPDWRAAGHPREALISSPAFWDGDRLVAAPFAMPQKGCNVDLRGGLKGLFAVAERR